MFLFLLGVALANSDCFAFQAQRKIIYGDSISYRHMCRYESGFFFRHELLLDYEYYWRVEPSIELFCDVDYDVFRFMAENKKKYGFVLSLYEYVETIPTLWDSVKNFTKEHPEYIHKNNAMGFLSDDGGDTYNHCHYWSNFEIGSLDFWRDKPYMDFFEKLDTDGGFFYERWGDAPVHSIAASLLLDKSEIHFFEDIAYGTLHKCDPYDFRELTHITAATTTYLLRIVLPLISNERSLSATVTLRKTLTGRVCYINCTYHTNFTRYLEANRSLGYSCLSRHFEINNLEKPEGYETQMD